MRKCTSSRSPFDQTLAVRALRSTSRAIASASLAALCAILGPTGKPAFADTRASADAAPPSRYSAYQPNFIVARHSEGDDNAIRARLSVKFRLAPVDREPANWYFKYTTEFDYYVTSRPSGPVVGRIHNPGFHGRLTRHHSFPGFLEFLDAGLEHRSNGQAVEVRSPADAARAQIAYDSGDHRYFDSVSRGADYLSLEAKANLTGSDDVYVKGKLFISQDSVITWGPLANTGTRVADYDRYTLRYTRDLSHGSDLDVEWTLGDRGLSTDSVNVALGLGIWKEVPLYFRVHFGPMNTLSNYTQSQRMIGFGVNFRPW